MKQKQGLHYAWLVCAGCAVIIFSTSGLGINAFSIYQPYMLSELAFTNTQVSTVLMLRSLSSFAGMLLTGVYYRRLSLRAGLVLAGAMTGMSHLLFGIGNSFPLYAAAAVVLGFGYGFGTVIPVAEILKNWFHIRLNTAVGICTAVTGLSTIGIPSVLTGIIEGQGLGTAFLWEGAAILLACLLSGILIRSKPEDKGMRAFGEGETGKETGTTGKKGTKDFAGHYSPLEEKEWRVLFPMMLLVGGLTSTGYSNFTLLGSSSGISPGTMAWIISASGATIMVSKCLYGMTADRIGAQKSTLLFYTAIFSGLLLCINARGNTALLAAGILLFSVGVSTNTVGSTAWAKELSASEDFGKNNRRFQIGYAGGGLAFSMVPGLLADRCNGSYVTAYIVFFGCALLILPCIQLTYRKHRTKSRNV